MGLSRWFFVETKSFEFAMEEGVSVSRVFERSRGIMHSISMGNVTVLWLLAILEELLKVEASKVLLKSSRVGSKAHTLSRGVQIDLVAIWPLQNMAVVARGSSRLSQKGWSGFVHELRKTIELSQTSSGDGQKVSLSHSSVSPSPSIGTLAQVPAEDVGKRMFIEVLVGSGHCTVGTTLPMEGHVGLVSFGQ